MLSRNEKEYLHAMARGKLSEFKHTNPSVLRKQIRGKAKGLDREIKDFVEDVALLDMFMQSDGIHFSGRAFLMLGEFRTDPRAFLAWLALGKVPKEREVLDARLEKLNRMERDQEAIRKSIEAQFAMINRFQEGVQGMLRTFRAPGKLSADLRALSNFAQAVARKIVARESRWVRSHKKRRLIFEFVAEHPGSSREEIANHLYAKGFSRYGVAPILKIMLKKEILGRMNRGYKLSAFGQIIKKMWIKLRHSRKSGAGA